MNARAGTYIQMKREHWLDVVEELKVLFPEHWREIAIHQDHIKLDVDYPRYEELARKDALHLVTVRADGQIVGYHLSVVSGHPHYASTLHAMVESTTSRPSTAAARPG